MSDNVVTNEKFKSESLKKRIEEISPKDSPWNLFQIMLQEVQATDIVENSVNGVDKHSPLTKQLGKLMEAIQDSTDLESSVKDLLLEYFPGYTTVKYWVEKKEWQDAVLRKVKDSKSFSHEKRVAVFNAIYKKATENLDMKAAELFCKLSGDLKEAKDAGKDSKELEDYKKFNSILIKK